MPLVLVPSTIEFPKVSAAVHFENVSVALHVLKYSVSAVEYFLPDRAVEEAILRR